MKPTYEEIEKMRRRVVTQAFEDQNASIGKPYYHVDIFHKMIKDVYTRGVADGKGEMEGLGLA